MKFRCFRRLHMFPYSSSLYHLSSRRSFASYFLKKLKINSQAGARVSFSDGSSGSQGNPFLLPGATVATILMLGALHARRLYDDKKADEAREKGIEFEFSPDVHASFLNILPLRTISRAWGFLTSVKFPVWMRPYVYKAWARAFHSNLDEAALPLEEYASLSDFFIRELKDGCRPIDPDTHCLVSPVDGIVLRFGELKGVGAMIEQVKGFSYSAPSLLGTNSALPMIAESSEKDSKNDNQEKPVEEHRMKPRWRISFAGPVAQKTLSKSPTKGLYFCVIYLKPGDYHRIHSPADWNILVRRHFSGRLLPVNERASRTIKNLYVENERVVLEGFWKQGFLALAAVGATNIGSIELFIEPELRTNKPKKKLFPADPPEERIYEPRGAGVILNKGDEVAAFNMGSTVVLIFQAPVVKPNEDGSRSEFRFCVKRGDRIRVGQAIGRLRDD